MFLFVYLPSNYNAIQNILAFCIRQCYCYGSVIALSRCRLCFLWGVFFLDRCQVQYSIFMKVWCAHFSLFTYSLSVQEQEVKYNALPYRACKVFTGSPRICGLVGNQAWQMQFKANRERPRPGSRERRTKPPYSKKPPFHGLIDEMLTKRRMSEAQRSAGQKHQESSIQTTEGGFG